MRASYTEYWNKVGRGWSQKGQANEILAEHRRKVHLDLIAKWAEIKDNQRILKTDLFEEAFGADQFLFDLAEANGDVIGIDISWEITRWAKRNAKHHGVVADKYLCGDVRQLPLRSNSVDLVISDSTLDHFSEANDIITALQEIKRVLRAGGILIITLDNKGKLGEPLRRLWMRLGLAPFFIGKTYSNQELKRVLQDIGFSVEGTTAIIHQPMLFLQLTFRFLHRLNARRFDPVLKRALVLLDTLEKRRTRYLTGLYIAAKAVKVATS